MDGLLRQTKVYLDGVSGRTPRVPMDAERLEARPSGTCAARPIAYVAAGAGSESTVAANRAAFERWRIVPRVLRDVGERDTSVELFGRRLPSPLLLAPIGVLELAHRGADLAVAEAARDTGTQMVLSNQASHPMEAVTAKLGDTPALVPALLEQVRRAGGEPRRPRRAFRLRGDRGDAGHDNPRLADP